MIIFNYPIYIIDDNNSDILNYTKYRIWYFIHIIHIYIHIHLITNHNELPF